MALGGIPPGWTQPAERPDQTLRLVSTNVNAFSDLDSPDSLEATLGTLDADVIIVIEQRAMQIEGMVRAADNFEDDLPRISHATAVFCREGLDCEARVTPEHGSQSMKMPMGIARLPGAEICFLGIHGPPPAPYDPTGIQPYMDWVASHIDDGRISVDWDPCLVGDRVVIAGDLNAVPWSRAWSTLLHRGLTDRLLSWGIWGASWPAGGGWPDLPFFHLDHLLLGPVEVPRVVHMRVPGADHKALVIDLKP
jgi:endonuclease/exonuclease/phosphatase (EEP) superfamily protein YafD